MDATTNTIEDDILRLVDGGAVFTDVKIEQDAEMLWRPPSGWEPTGFGVTRLEDIQRFLLLIDPEWEDHLRRGTFERTIQFDQCRLRCNIYTTRARKRYSIVIRKHPPEPPSIETVGVPMTIMNSLGYARGLLIVTGPTGSGKTTTIAAILQHLLDNRPLHVVTVEDNNEFDLRNGRGTVSQKIVPHDTDTFNDGLKDALRQKADVIMIGEVRDHDTAETMFMAMEAGHLVIASMHTNGTDGVVSRLLSFFPPEEESGRLHTLSLYLIGVLGQALIPTRDGMAYALATETLYNSSEVGAALRGRQFDKIRKIVQTGSELNSHINKALAQLWTDKIIDKREAIRASHDPMALAQTIQKLEERSVHQTAEAR